MRTLSRQRTAVEPHEDYGFFGPDSVTWKVWGYPTSLTVGFQRAVVVERRVSRRFGNDKRTAIEFAVEHLVKHAPRPVDYLRQLARLAVELDPHRATSASVGGGAL